MNQIKVDETNIEELFIYWLEKYRTSTKRGYPVTLLFDMYGTGLKNLSLEFIRFILHTFKYYYPCCLGSLLVYESPSILNASWKLVKSWMDTMMQSCLRHITRESIGNYISPYYVPIEMGGEDTFEFAMDRLGMYIPTQLDDKATGADNRNAPSPDLDGFSKQRNVRFDGDKPEVMSSNDSGVNHGTSATENTTGSASGSTENDIAVFSSSTNDSTSARKSSIIKRNSIPLPVSLEFLAEARRNAPSSDIYSDKFLSICPKDIITLNIVHGELDPVDVLALKNEGTKNVVYKIKITSPEKFRVRPSTGIISAGETEFIRVYLQNEYKHSITRERFLIMAAEVQTFENTDFATVWKNASVKAKVEHKLKCNLNRGNNNSYSQGSYQPNLSNTHMVSSFSEQAAALAQQFERISRRQKLFFFATALIILLQLFSIFLNITTQSYVKSMQQYYPVQDISPANVEPIDVDSEL